MSHKHVHTLEPGPAGVTIAAGAEGVLAQEVVPPVARVEPHGMTAHGHTRVDPYFWLREREDPGVIAYLEAENAYADAVMAHTAALQETIFEEIRGRIREDDASVPVRDKDYFYYTRYEAGREYPVHARRRGSMEGPEEVILDANELAEGHGYFSLSRVVVSPSQQKAAFAVDTVGRRVYALRFKDLRTGRVLEDRIPHVTGNVVWAGDDETVLYTRQDPETLRWHQVWRHRLGTDPRADVLVYEETDPTFGVHVSRTKSEAYLLIECDQTLASEVRYLPADDPEAEPRVLLPRERGHEYSVEHFGEHFYVRTNADGATNFKLVRTPVGATGRDGWEEVLPARDDVYLQGIEIFRDHLVVTEREDGLIRLRVRPWSGGAEHYVDFGEAAYAASPVANPSFDTRVLRYAFTSLVTPPSVYDYDMATRTRTLLKRDEVLGGYEPSDYAVERRYAVARDGTRVPVSLVYRKGLRREGGNPLLLYAYGSYGASTDAAFSAARLSLLDRGFVYAIAHVRGGQELGRRWYEGGKLLRKMNTFTDFIDAAEMLVEEGYTRPDRLFAMGGSAGGLLVGAVVNLRPDLFEGAVAAVPFVDVVTTMLDASIPLTTGEYDEWGDPRDPAYYRYMLAYSPYDNVEAKDYPHLLVTTGLHDSQVQYWEPAKWVARLRATKTDANRLLLRTNMEAGHGGASGRFRRYREIALEYAFLVDLAGRAAPTTERTE